MGPGKFQIRTMRILSYNTLYKYDLHSVVLADLLYKTKPHYSEDRTMRIRTMRGLAVLAQTPPFLMFS